MNDLSGRVLVCIPNAETIKPRHKDTAFRSPPHPPALLASIKFNLDRKGEGGTLQNQQAGAGMINEVIERPQALLITVE